MGSAGDRKDSRHATRGGTGRRTDRRGGQTTSSKRRAQAAHAPGKRKRPDTSGPCPIMRTCGGCEWLGMPYRKQLARKAATMEELFAPVIARFGCDVVVDPVEGMGATSGTSGAAPAPRAFRYKAATPFAPGKGGTVRGGFFARGTHRIVACSDCAVEAPGARAILNEVARAAADLRISAFDEDAHRGQLRHAVLRLGWKRDEGVLTLVTANRDVPRLDALAEHMLAFDSRITCVAHNVNPRPGNAILGPQTTILAGEPCMHDELLGCTFAISPTAFYQTNPAQTETLYRLAIEGMDLADGDILLDAYCGSGTIGLCAAHAAREAGRAVTLLGVERNPSGIADALLNAQLNKLDDTSQFVAADATAYMRDMAARGAHADVVVLDPPRAGSTPEFLAAARALEPHRIVYVSCNPTTQVRDLAELGQAGWRLERLTPVDMFPHTSHVETVAVLGRA